ncbi:MFS transporter [Ferrovibrio terrae]|uniref:MFS transporter n=1 Tax=Ferrovibrio terrae TaxID=2594003 RepID=A0A516H702_9PROT|nr:MFS transporter [Ferrovibrio terrae]QDO99522.1 MFS transporter [Ferrovibrio terrae]
MPAKFFYGWVVVAAAFLTMFTCFGAAYSFPAFFEPLSREFGATRGTVSLVFSAAGFLYFALGAISGRLADRIGPQPVVGFGLACVAAGMFATSFADSLTAIIIFYGVGIGIGVGFAYVPAIGTVQRWFVAKRGQASGWAVAGIGIGTMAAPPAAAYAIEVFGWRGAYIAFGFATLVLGVLATLLLRASPASMGLQPDGAAAPVNTAPTAPAGLELGQVLRHRVFWLLYLACALNCIGTFVPFVHLAPYATDQGLSRIEGVWLVGLIGVGSTLGRFVLGGLADRIGRDRSLALIMLLNGAALAYWSVAQGFTALAIFALVFGLFYGGFVALVPAFTADLFGLRAMSAVLGVLYTSVAFGTLLGPTLAGWVFDTTGSYTWPILICTAGCVVSALMVWKLPRV